MPGVLPDSAIRAMISQGAITAAEPVTEAQIQPASLDLRLGRMAYRIRASFLAGKGTRVEAKLVDLEMHRMDLSDGAVLEKGCVYLVPPSVMTRVSRSSRPVELLALATAVTPGGSASPSTSGTR